MSYVALFVFNFKLIHQLLSSVNCSIQKILAPFCFDIFRLFQKFLCQLITVGAYYVSRIFVIYVSGIPFSFQPFWYRKFSEYSYILPSHFCVGLSGRKPKHIYVCISCNREKNRGQRELKDSLYDFFFDELFCKGISREVQMC